MIQFVQAFGNWIMMFVRMLDSVTLWSFFTLWDLILSFIILCMVTSIFWKGAKA